MMLQGVPALVGNPGDAAAATAEAHNSGGGGVGPISGGFNEEDKGRSEEGERNSGGNRWPRQETMALLKIRSDMDVAFRDSGLKGPLWEDVSRKLAELGYHRSAKKCKEKFENVYKYHKRTKDGRTTKADGKSYRFFEQLEAFDTHPPQLLPLPQPPPPALPPQTKSQPAIKAATTAMSIPMSTTNLPIVPQLTVPSTTNPNLNPTNLSPPPPPAPPPPIITKAPIPYQIHTSVVSNSTSSSSTSSDEEPERRPKRKRIWKEFFGRLMKEVIDKQEELQRKFLEALERREHDRMMREETWRVQEMAKMNREHELLIQERSIAAAKDAAVISFLQKMTEQQHSQNPNPTLQLIQVQENPPPQPPPPAQPQQPPPPPEPPMNADNVVDKFMSPSPSRWPKAEIQALIKLRTTLDMKYQENAPKGPLWEEISAAMRNLGYNRNAKRCKEKWENINKYYKKVKESNKKRPEDAKTCPYFHQLEAIYKEKAKSIDNGNRNGNGNSLNPPKSENPMVPIMARPEQQWPHESEKNDLNDDDDTGEDDDEDDDEEDEADGYEIVTNKASSMGTVE